MTEQIANKTYPCSRCEGKGSLQVFNHVLGGVCFRCAGSGQQRSKPSVSIKWAVFGMDAKGTAGRIYNVNAKTPTEAVVKARAIFIRASEIFQNTWDMSQAYAIAWDEANQLESVA